MKVPFECGYRDELTLGQFEDVVASIQVLQVIGAQFSTSTTSPVR